MVSKWKQKRIEKMWDDGWSVGAICKKVNVTKYIVYQYTGRIAITEIKERRLKLSKDYLPLALKKRLETMTSDTFKKIGSENVSLATTVCIDVDPLFYMIQQIIENHGGLLPENELEDLVNGLGWFKDDHEAFQVEMKRIIEKSNQTDGTIRQYYGIKQDTR
jgi:hypothetical protein